MSEGCQIYILIANMVILWRWSR